MITQPNSAQQFNPQVPQQFFNPAQTVRPMENKIDGVALVASDAEITNYPVTGGATVALIDLARNLLVLKTNDIYFGKGLYYVSYDLKKKEPVQPVQNANDQSSSDLMNQIQTEIASLKKEYGEMYKMLEELTAPQKEAK